MAAERMTSGGSEAFLASLAGIGLAIGLGQLLASGEQLTLRIIVGRAVCSSGLAVSAAGLLAWMPDLSPTALAGIAAALASLGTSFLERVLSRFIFGPMPASTTTKTSRS